MLLTLYHTILTFNDLKLRAFENIVGKGENADNQKFLLFPQCFLPSKTSFPYFILFCFVVCKINAFNLDPSKILSFGKELKWKSKKFCNLTKNFSNFKYERCWKGYKSIYRKQRKTINSSWCDKVAGRGGVNENMVHLQESIKRLND